MHRHQHFPVAARYRGASVAIGNFDGVHLGHQAVLDAARPHGPLGVVTFEPHPRSHFAPNAPAFRLMNAAARASRLEKLGVDQLYEVPFDGDLAALSAEAFARDVLSDGLGIAHATIGADFRFGAGRKGDAAGLAALGQKFGFGVTIAPLVALDAGEVSSTSIRNALSDGRPGDAATMLGHWHRIEGIVRHGEKRGRTLGYPTANLALDGLHLPRFGVYAVLVDILTGLHAGSYHGAASLGTRPQFDGEVPNLETFIFDFEGDIYDAELSVALVDFQRPEATFDGLDAFISQMEADCKTARATLRRAAPL